MGKAWFSRLLIAVAFGVVSSAYAGDGASRVFVTSCVQALLVNPLTADFSGKPISIRFPDSDALVSISLGRKLGSGLGANVYVVDSHYFDFSAKASSGVVAKLGHTPFWRLQPSALQKFNAIIESEFDQFTALKTSLPTLRNEPDFPEDFGWAKDPEDFPFADIIGRGKFEEGSSVLFKQRIRGSTPKEIYEKYGDQLPRELVEGLKNIYNLSKVLYRKVKFSGEPFKLDIYPSNFIWVEKSDDLKLMGLTRPSFLMVEASNHPKPIFQENYSFDQFESDYKAFIRLNAR